METALLKKLSKCDPLEIVYWIASCEYETSDKEAAIEYAMNCILCLNYRNNKKKRKVTRQLIQRTLESALTDIDNIETSYRSAHSDLKTFSSPFLIIRGEGYPWQLGEASLARYGKHDLWMLNNLGFTIQDAYSFSKEITKMTVRKKIMQYSEGKLPKFLPLNMKSQKLNRNYICAPPRQFVKYWKTGITFTKAELRKKISSEKHERFDGFLKRMSFRLGDFSMIVKNPNDFNILYRTPILNYNEKFIIPIPRLLWHSLSKTFHYDFLKDDKYIEKYIDEKGLAAERRMLKFLQRLFSNDCIFPRVKYLKRKGFPDIDLVINHNEYLLFFECTAKWITQAAKAGNSDAILENLRLSLLKCNNQLKRAINAYKNGELTEFPKNQVVIPIIVIDDPIPMLELALKNWKILRNDKPYIIDIYELDTLSEISEKNEFVDFINKRRQLIGKDLLVAAGEIDYLLCFRKPEFKNVINQLEETNNSLIFIGHLEISYPTYYKDHFIKFLDDPRLAESLEKTPTDWSNWS